MDTNWHFPKERPHFMFFFPIFSCVFIFWHSSNIFMFLYNYMFLTKPRPIRDSTYGYLSVKLSPGPFISSHFWWPAWNMMETQSWSTPPSTKIICKLKSHHSITQWERAANRVINHAQIMCPKNLGNHRESSLHVRMFCVNTVKLNLRFKV